MCRRLTPLLTDGILMRPFDGDIPDPADLHPSSSAVFEFVAQREANAATLLRRILCQHTRAHPNIALAPSAVRHINLDTTTTHSENPIVHRNAIWRAGQINH